MCGIGREGWIYLEKEKTRTSNLVKKVSCFYISQQIYAFLNQPNVMCLVIKNYFDVSLFLFLISCNK